MGYQLYSLIFSSLVLVESLRDRFTVQLFIMFVKFLYCCFIVSVLFVQFPCFLVVNLLKYFIK